MYVKYSVSCKTLYFTTNKNLLKNSIKTYKKLIKKICPTIGQLIYIQKIMSDL